MQSLLAHALRRGIASDYVAKLLTAFGGVGSGQAVHDAHHSVAALRESSASSPLPPLIEPLSERERDVLRLLVAGRSGPQIADALVVAPSTVKTHLKSIYGKMDVHSRDQAIVRARDLGLL